MFPFLGGQPVHHGLEVGPNNSNYLKTKIRSKLTQKVCCPSLIEDTFEDIFEDIIVHGLRLNL